jgi:5-aminopentanamidase
MGNTRRIAGIQTDITLANTSSNLERMQNWLSRPELQDCNLVVFPECMLSGYCFDSVDEAWEHAQSIPGPATDAIVRRCKELGLFVAFGMLERGQGAEIHNSCVLIGPSGVVAAYQKVHLPYLGIDRFTTRGRQPFLVHDIDGMKLGMHICYDGSFPEAARVMALEGADLLILPTNWPPGAETFARYLPNARALENNVYFMAVDRVGRERAFTFIGQSRICDTNGVTMDEGSATDEAILIATIDLDRARNKRLVRVPGAHVIDRFADRQPEYYKRVCS